MTIASLEKEVWSTSDILSKRPMHTMLLIEIWLFGLVD
jgi:hypothetical protein